MDRVISLDHAAIFAQRVAGVGVHVEPRIIARISADSISFLEDIAFRIERDGDQCDLAQFEPRCQVKEPRGTGRGRSSRPG